MTLPEIPGVDHYFRRLIELEPEEVHVRGTVEIPVDVGDGTLGGHLHRVGLRPGVSVVRDGPDLHLVILPTELSRHHVVGPGGKPLAQHAAPCECSAPVVVQGEHGHPLRGDGGTVVAGRDVGGLGEGEPEVVPVVLIPDVARHRGVQREVGGRLHRVTVVVGLRPLLDLQLQLPVGTGQLHPVLDRQRVGQDQARYPRSGFHQEGVGSEAQLRDPFGLDAVRREKRVGL